ncbi:outer membrane protein assembly factor BamB family protein [Paenibacillus albus]|uniref:Pyrrolo-quinoline quinone repeat domain-containing protein n=1 Tax=Paenibacillus albus TaxID=2495582 RepID=A0A3Q8X3N7_9BACL|nr:PQQ-binding-like beta-propeller repeat protein [Paenibacillus albus]AZN39020.1 hypothetical protein EJC50_04560 [Paenibacillus albus]
MKRRYWLIMRIVLLASLATLTFVSSYAANAAVPVTIVPIKPITPVIPVTPSPPPSQPATAPAPVYNGKVLWKFVSRKNISPPLVAPDGSVYATVEDPDQNNEVGTGLYAFTGAGKMKWMAPITHPGSKEFNPRMAIGIDGTVYLGDSDGILHAISPSNGAEKWSFRVGEAFTAAPVIGQDGTIFITTGSQLIAITAAGKKKLSFSVSNVALAPAIGKDGTIYVGDATYLTIYNANGTLKRKVNLVGTMAASPPVLASDKLYMIRKDMSYRTTLGAYKLDGTWMYDIRPSGLEPQDTPVLSAGGTLLYVTSDRDLYAIRVADLTVAWKYSFASGIRSSPVLGPNSTVVSRSKYSHVAVLDAATGKTKWMAEWPYNQYSLPSVSKDGTVYISDSGTLYAIGIPKSN